MQTWGNLIRHIYKPAHTNPYAGYLEHVETELNTIIVYQT